MRIHLQTTPNIKVVPFNYQEKLVSVFHHWLGPNDIHDELSLYSLSWFSHGNRVKDGLNFHRGARFFISAPDMDLIKRMIDGIQKDPEIAWGMRVAEMILEPPPDFGGRKIFFVQSPVLVKRTVDHEIEYYYPKDPESDTYMTETLRHKLQKAGKGNLEVAVKFDRGYRSQHIKLVRYKGIDKKGTLCPVIVEGDPEAVKFAWEVGVGNGTGIGFGALK